jgi:hypothetical protein
MREVPLVTKMRRQAVSAAESQKPDENPAEESGLTTPYGAQHGHTDRAAGGADSSPQEALSSEEREAAEKARRRDSTGSGS